MSVRQPTHVGSLFCKRLRRGIGRGGVLVSVLRAVAQNRSEEVIVPEGNGSSASAEEETDWVIVHGQTGAGVVSTCGCGSSACTSSSAASSGTGTAPPSWGSPGCSSSRLFRRRCGCCARRSSGCAARPPPPTPREGRPSPAPSRPGSRHLQLLTQRRRLKGADFTLSAGRRERTWILIRLLVPFVVLVHRDRLLSQNLFQLGVESVIDFLPVPRS